MKRQIFMYLGIVILFAMLISSVLVFAGGMSADSNKLVLIILSVAWFATAPFWISPKEN